MEAALRSAVLDWLRADPVLAEGLNAITEETPPAATRPWLGIAASAASEWGTKTRPGREVRLALELHTRGDEPRETALLADRIEERIAQLPPDPSRFHIASCAFLRSRFRQDGRHERAMLIEYRFRILAT